MGDNRALFDEIERMSGKREFEDPTDPARYAHLGSSPLERVTSMVYSNPQTCLSDVSCFVQSLMDDHQTEDGENGLMGVFFTPNSAHPDKLKKKPTGFVAFVENNCPVSPLLLSEDMCRYNILVPVRGFAEEFVPGKVKMHIETRADSDPPENSYYSKKEEKKMERIPDAHISSERVRQASMRIPQYSHNGPSMSNMRLVRGYGGKLVPQEIKEWNHELGENGSVGIFSRVEEDTPQRKKWSYYVMVSSNVPAASRQFVKYVKECPGMTYEQMVASPQYRYLKKLSLRNACRIAQEFADSHALEIDTQADRDSYLRSNSHCYTDMARPAIAQPSNYFARLEDGTGRSYVQYMDANTSADDVQNQLLVFQGHYHPMIAFNVVDGAEDLQRREGTRRGMHSAINAMPVSSGREKSTSHLNRMVASERKDMHDVARKINWDQAPSFNPRLHPNAYHKISDSFVNQLQRMSLARQSGDLRMVPGEMGVSKYTPEKSRVSTPTSRKRFSKKQERELQKLMHDRAPKKSEKQADSVPAAASPEKKESSEDVERPEVREEREEDQSRPETVEKHLRFGVQGEF